MNWYKQAQAIILSDSEKRWAEWAIDPMFDYWCTEEGEWERGDGPIYNESQLPRIIGNNFVLSPVMEINEDLLYRLEEQAVSVSETDAGSEQQVSARARSALSLAKKIRDSI